LGASFNKAFILRKNLVRGEGAGGAVGAADVAVGVAGAAAWYRGCCTRAYTSTMGSRIQRQRSCRHFVALQLVSIGCPLIMRKQPQSYIGAPATGAAPPLEEEEDEPLPAPSPPRAERNERMSENLTLFGEDGSSRSISSSNSNDNSNSSSSSSSSPRGGPWRPRTAHQLDVVAPCGGPPIR
jgi:hypothetical protein